MGFGSYDESEQENQEIDTDDVEDNEQLKSDDSNHDGEIDFEMEDTSSAIERLKEIQGEEDEEEEEEEE